MARLTELGGLRETLGAEQAAALIAITTTHQAWHELLDAYGLSWDAAETLLCDTLGQAVLEQAPPDQTGKHEPRPPRLVLRRRR